MDNKIDLYNKTTDELIKELQKLQQEHDSLKVLYQKNITAHKQAEESLKNLSQRSQFALDLCQIGEWDLDLISHAASRSPRHDRIFGYDEMLPEWTYEIFLEHVIPEDRELVDKKFNGAIAAHQDWDFECRIMRCDQKLCWIWATGQLFLGKDGKPCRLTGIVQDITHRKTAEEKIKTTYDAFISILNVYPGILKIIDPESYEIILVNKIFADKLPEYGIGKKCYEVFYGLTSPCDFCTNEIIKNNGRQPYSWERYNPATKTDYLYTDQLIMWPDGRDVRFEIAIDISERKKTEDLLKITLGNLERSNKELEQFAYVASHDLQEPLRMVSSYTQLLEKRYKDKLDVDALDFIHYAVDGANRMQKLINDLLDFSRVTIRGKDFEQVNTSQLLNQAISNLQQLITDNSALITTDELPILKADESQIIRVFQNLIENAIKFKKKTESPQIHIFCKKKNNFYEFAVSDNGIGIDLQYHDRIFTIFQRLHSIKDYPGTGIGLSICKRIIERHGGTIWFESKENEGTTFYFTLNSLKKNKLT